MFGFSEHMEMEASDYIDEMENDVEENVPDGLETEIEDDEADDSIVEEAIIAGTIFGIGVEEGQKEKAVGKLPTSERSPGAVSLMDLEKPAGKKKLRPFEQWVDDVIHGRKTLDDDL